MQSFLEYGNNDEDDVKNGLELPEQLGMDQYKAPMQYTPSCGLHDRFCVDEEQAKRLGSTTRITYVGTTFAMYVKFKIGLCNCQPSKTEGDGENKFKIAYQLLDIPKLPDELFNLRRRPAPQTKVQQVAQAYGKNTVMQLSDCITVKQLNDYGNWIQLGMVLKNIGAPLKVKTEGLLYTMAQVQGEQLHNWGSEVSSERGRC